MTDADDEQAMQEVRAKDAYLATHFPIGSSVRCVGPFAGEREWMAKVYQNAIGLVVGHYVLAGMTHAGYVNVAFDPWKHREPLGMCDETFLTTELQRGRIEWIPEEGG